MCDCVSHWAKLRGLLCPPGRAVALGFRAVVVFVGGVGSERASANRPATPAEAIVAVTLLARMRSRAEADVATTERAPID